MWLITCWIATAVSAAFVSSSFRSPHRLVKSHTPYSFVVSHRRVELNFLGSTSTHEENDDESNSSSSSAFDLVKVTQDLAEPIQGVLDEYTGGWALSYADLTPESPDTVIGRGFLMTNLFYLVAGVLLTYQGDPTLGFFTDLAAIASFNYHYTQLRATSRADLKQTVRLSLFLDYMAAGISILTAIVYLISTSTVALTSAPDEIGAVEWSVVVGMMGVSFLALSWKYEYGRPYIIYHSLWHLCSAWSGYLIGAAHLDAMGPH